MLDTATDKVAGVIDRLISAAEIAMAKGFAIDVIELLHAGVAAVRLSQANSPRFDANSPEIREMIKQSRADYARGDYRYLDDLIHAV